jgi:hypothetical protein
MMAVEADLAEGLAIRTPRAIPQQGGRYGRSVMA